MDDAAIAMAAVIREVAATAGSRAALLARARRLAAG